jgi:hypothetical protein
MMSGGGPHSSYSEVVPPLLQEKFLMCLHEFNGIIY